MKPVATSVLKSSLSFQYCITRRSTPLALLVGRHYVPPVNLKLELNMENSDYIRDQLQECFKVIDSCLSCIYSGDTHMYRALAGQLRLLLCDSSRGKNNSLLYKVYPESKISAIKPIKWDQSQTGDVTLHQTEKTHSISTMPFKLIIYKNGLVVSDLKYNNKNMLSIDEWIHTQLTVHPIHLTPAIIIRTVADKGGGAHVDSNSSVELRMLYKKTPTGRMYSELFILALGRFAQKIGENIFNYKGVEVSDELTKSPYYELENIMAAHNDYVDALKFHNRK